MNSLEERLERIERKLDQLLALRSSGDGARGTSAAASSAGQDIDVDIDGPRGDPEVRFMPKRWTGPDRKGQKFSACEPEFLDLLADAYEWFAQRDDESGAVDKNGTPKSRWSRLDAARARAWSARLRGGEAPAANRRARPASPPPAPARRAPPPGYDDAADDSDIPF